jgi:hypothetical protein
MPFQVLLVLSQQSITVQLTHLLNWLFRLKMSYFKTFGYVIAKKNSYRIIRNYVLLLAGLLSTL